MKLKLTYTILVFTGLSLLSCRESDDVATVTSIENANRNYRKSINDSVKTDSLNNFGLLEKDPPKTGTDWRKKN